MLKHKVNQLFNEQISEWKLARDNYDALKYLRVKTLDVNGHPYKIQFNPARIVSSSAKIDTEHISRRPCNLCRANRPSEQKGVPFGNRYIVLVNPFPIFSRHLTIADVEHTPQIIVSRFGDMLDLAEQLDDYTVFYNGPKCGASIPDHFHFQAGNKGVLPIENDRFKYNAICFESENRQEMIKRFREIYENLPTPPDHPEPMLNMLTLYEIEQWTTWIFPRTKHRPACYATHGATQLLITPGSVEMGGLFITPLEKDFEKITAEDIARILHEVLKL